MQACTYDTINLRYYAAFDVPVSQGLSWVPLNCLGGTRYDQRAISKIANLTPSEKQKNIRSVYEAIQLLQSCNFSYSSDSGCNGESTFNKYWIHHKPGYISVQSNAGCCTDLASWLDYLVQDNYPERGYLWFFRPDSSNHVLNYFFHKGFYYLLDVTAMLKEKAIRCCPETGNKREYINSHYPSGVCFKCRELDAFIKFHSRIQKFHGFSFLYVDVSSYNAIPPIATDVAGDKLSVFFSFPCRILLESPKIQPFFKEEKLFSLNWNLFKKTSSKSGKCI